MKAKIIDYSKVTIGVFIVAFAIHVFMVPNNFVIGGISSLAIIINQILSVDVGVIMFITNLLLFLLGFLTIGSHFGAKTIISSFLMSSFVWALERFFPMDAPLTNDRFVELIFCIIITAIGMAIVFRSNASTGGTDIIAKILNKFFGIDLGKGVLIADVAVTSLAFFVFDLNTVFYGIVGIFLNGLAIDFILEKFKERKEIRIITDDLEDVKQYIMIELEKGATIYKGVGAYTNEPRAIITTILSRQEYIKLKRYIAKEKIQAFITVTNIVQTYGLGFESIEDDV